LLTVTDWEYLLWWTMVGTGIVAAALSVATSIFDRSRNVWLTNQRRFFLHIASYGFLTISILTFVLRGLLTPA
jgi:hypothetical protein